MGRYEYHERLSTFVLEGRFLGFDPNSGGKLKYFHLATAEGEVELKLAKPLRYSVGPQLTPGDWIVVQGEQKLKKYGEIKRKVWSIRSTGAVTQAAPATPTTADPDQDPKQAKGSEAQDSQPRLGCIQVCRKSDCCKRGGSQVLQALERAVQDHPEGERIQVRPIGCMKNCKAGPNVVIMPGRARYSQVRPEDVPRLMEQHFPAQVPSS